MLVRARAKRRTMIWGVAAGLIAAALVFASAPSGSSAAEEQVIDTAAPVRPQQCAPCHLDLGDVDVPGLIFSHGNHLLVSCDACHARMPHRGDDTERIPMEVCFACHGVSHGEMGELATKKCEDCHTPSFTLRPKSHTRDWAKKPHAEVADERGVNGCMMCHEAPKDCDACHAKEAPALPKMPAAYHSLVQPRPKGPRVTIDPDGPVTMSQCYYCHPDIDDLVPGRLIFAHVDHLSRNYRCEACHQTFPHAETGIVRPDMLSCYRCHGMVHNAGGLVATEKCEACHPKQFELMPGDHTMEFILGRHKDRADVEPEYCAMCHRSADFCVGCHRGEKTSPNAPGRPVIPADHTRADWMGKHGGIYLEGAGACGSCHDDPSCKRCHKTVMPHPVDWIEDHRPDPGVSRDDCGVCHRDRNSCQQCHHSEVRRAKLTRENCTPCHPEMKQVPATAIKHKSFSEHAVHFDVAKKGGTPFGCYECHAFFGTSEADRQAALQQGHDLRLCASCHGASDPVTNEPLAPYSGRELCLRCHTDLNL